MLRTVFAGALALACALSSPASAKGYDVIRGYCMCWTGGMAVAFKAKWAASCAKVCNAPERRPDLRPHSFDGERPQRDHHEFRSNWSEAAQAGEITDVSAARRIGHNRNHIRNASLPPARYRGGGGSRIRRGIVPPPRMDLARASQTDRDGRGYVSPGAGVSAPIRTATHRRALGVARAAIQGARASSQVAVEHSRPSQCYGIPWCGCWLRTVLGLSDPGLNLAANWARVGQPATIETANIVVWPHHVGKLLGHRPGQLLIQSGNDGGAVRTRWVSPNIRGHVLAYRRV